MTIARSVATSPIDRFRWALQPVQLVILMAMLLPLGFVGWAWQHGGGLAYFEDANESILDYTHARNLQRFSFTQTFFLTFEGTEPDADGPQYPYTHNPNLPRYLNYVLLLLGVESLPLQILILSLTSTLGAMVLLRVLLANLVPDAPLAALVVLLAVVLDSMGFLSWTVNTYRVLSFVLLWGALASIIRPRSRWLPFLAGFMVFFFEYGFAVFAGTAVLVFAVLRDGRAALPRLRWFALGAALALIVFGLQVLGYLGLSGVSSDLAQTVARRGASVELAAVGEQLVEAVTRRYGWFIPLTSAWALLTSPLVLIPAVRRTAERGDALIRLRLGLGQLQLSLGLGCAMTVLLLRGFFLDAYVVHFLPCLVFLLGVGVATVATDIALGIDAVRRRREIAARHRQGIAVGGSKAGLVLASLLAAGIMLTNFGRVFDLFPPLSGDLVPLLASKYRGLPFVGLTVRVQLAYALTGVPAERVWVFVTDDDLERVARLRTPDGQLYYLCIDPAERGPICDFIDGWHIKLGHTVVDRGKDWSIVRLAAQNAPGPRPPGPPEPSPNP